MWDQLQKELIEKREYLLKTPEAKRTKEWHIRLGAYESILTRMMDIEEGKTAW